LVSIGEIATILGAIAAIGTFFLILYQYWLKGRSKRKKALQEVVNEILEAKQKAKKGELAFLRRTRDLEHEMPKRTKKEIAKFNALLDEQWYHSRSRDDQILLSIYRAVGRFPKFRGDPDKKWIIRTPEGGQMQEDSVEDSLYEILKKPLSEVIEASLSLIKDISPSFHETLIDMGISEREISEFCAVINQNYKHHSEETQKRFNKINSRISEFRFKTLRI